jgi:hypothetical protein
MMPAIHVNYLAILVAVVAQMIIGFLWFGPLFGKVWARENGKPADYRPTSGEMIRATLLQILAAFLIAFVLTHSLNVWRPSVWMAGPDAPNWVYGLNSAFFTWIGFFVPIMLSALAWGGRTWKLFLIDASGNFLILLASGMILAYMR